MKIFEIIKELLGGKGPTEIVDVPLKGKYVDAEGLTGGKLEEGVLPYLQEPDVPQAEVVEHARRVEAANKKLEQVEEEEKFVPIIEWGDADLDTISLTRVQRAYFDKLRTDETKRWFLDSIAKNYRKKKK